MIVKPNLACFFKTPYSPIKYFLGLNSSESRVSWVNYKISRFQFEKFTFVSNPRKYVFKECPKLGLASYHSRTSLYSVTTLPNQATMQEPPSCNCDNRVGNTCCNVQLFRIFQRVMKIFPQFAKVVFFSDFKVKQNKKMTFLSS